MKKELKSKLEYATHLASFGESLIYEDYFKLVSLCSEITILKQNGVTADEAIEREFYAAIFEIFKKSGQFRGELERHPGTKEFVCNIVKMKENLMSKMECATYVASFEGSLTYKEYIKLASLCSEIATLMQNGVTADEAIERVFCEVIINFFKQSGQFRLILERYPNANKLVRSI